MIPSKINGVYKNAECLYTRDQVEHALDNMARAIHNEMEEKNPLVLSVMIGATVVTGHLLTRLDFPLELDYVHATRYQGELNGNDVHWRATPKTDLNDRVVLVIDDVLDDGVTLKHVVDYCQAQGAKRVYTAVLVDKYHERSPDGMQTSDFIGLRADQRYIFGFGLDYKEYLRNAPGIFAVGDE